ncbi:MAG: flagellar hook-basal body complex protein FliE [Chloroflexi bacterium]|nr:flagellar hook-basal body complex protein FliE [Chloroflexota bacterium]
MNINSIPSQSIQGVNPLRPEVKPDNAAQQIGQTFDQALESLSNQQNHSDQLLEKLAVGENVELHQVMLATEQTDINFRIAIAIRDRLVDAYREINRMTV